MKDEGFVAKANSLRPRPSLLYLKVQVNEKNASCLIDMRATHSFISTRLAKEMHLLMWRRDKLHDIKEVELHVILKSGALEFVEDFTLYGPYFGRYFFERPHNRCKVKVDAPCCIS